jgi:hypothetical protein
MMNKILLAVVLGVPMVAVAQTAQPAQGQSAAPAPSQAAAQPVIKDPAEYNAYVAAVDPKKDVNSRISALEAFLTQYPNSVMKNQALEVLLVSYQGAGNVTKALETAKKLLAADSCRVPALFLLTYVNRVQAQSGADLNGKPASADVLKQESADAGKFGQQGLDCLPKYTKPEGTSDADFQNQVKAMKENFLAGIGFSALQDKDYAKAAQFLKDATDANAPDSQKDLMLMYPLALSYLSTKPADYQNGIWYAARAAAIAPPANAPALEGYAKGQYRKFHAGDDGWDEVMAAAKAGGPQPVLKPAPSPADQAHEFVTKTPPDKMDFAIWEFVLANGSQADQDTVWNAIKGKPVPAMIGVMISATPAPCPPKPKTAVKPKKEEVCSQQFMIAGSADDIDSKTPDITLNFEELVTDKLIPKDGANVTFLGEPVSYTPNPFMLVLEKGRLAAPKPAAPAHKAATTHKAQ